MELTEYDKGLLIVALHERRNNLKLNKPTSAINPALWETYFAEIARLTELQEMVEELVGEHTIIYRPDAIPTWEHLEWIGQEGWTGELHKLDVHHFVHCSTHGDTIEPEEIALLSSEKIASHPNRCIDCFPEM